jgi:Asp-tRNA(Asn)/Glu-tRNA(Gln) amidotransferase A subunit family amidase
VQLVARHGADGVLLSMAAGLEEALGVRRDTPMLG